MMPHQSTGAGMTAPQDGASSAVVSERDRVLALARAEIAILTEQLAEHRREQFQAFEAEVGREVLSVMLQDRAAAERYLADPDPARRRCAVDLLANHWGPKPSWPTAGKRWRGRTRTLPCGTWPSFI